jgi:hypothetical protein
MNMSPIISKALIESRQRDRLAEGRQARLAREAEQASRAARAARPARRPVAKRHWRLGLARLLWTH